jgi:hypothetical protein
MGTALHLDMLKAIKHYPPHPSHCGDRPLSSIPDFQQHFLSNIALANHKNERKAS